jgi:hypothetical protein
VKWSCRGRLIALPAACFYGITIAAHRLDGVYKKPLVDYRHKIYI